MPDTPIDLRHLTFETVLQVNSARTGWLLVAGDRIMPVRTRRRQPDLSPAPGGNTRPHLPAKDFEARRSPPAVKNATSGSHRCPCLPLQTAGPFRSALLAVRRKPGGGEPPRGLRARPPRASGWVPTRPTKRLDRAVDTGGCSDRQTGREFRALVGLTVIVAAAGSAGLPGVIGPRTRLGRRTGERLRSSAGTRSRW